MASSGLSPASKAAIARLRAYNPPATQYEHVPVSRRAAVLILLFADQMGELRVVLTMRAKRMSSYAGHAALPGGKADFPHETPFQTARREASEEIGLPLSDADLPHPYTIEHLCQLPANLAKTELAVRPCVAFLSATRKPSGEGKEGEVKSVERSLIPQLNAQEVAAVFTAPFHNFLLATDEFKHESVSAATPNEAQPRGPGVEASGFPAQWYRGVWTDWHEQKWRMHNFYVPVDPKMVALPKKNKTAATGESPNNAAEAQRRNLPARDPNTQSSPPAPAEEAPVAVDGTPWDLDPYAQKFSPGSLPSRYRVFGMTARILVDCARLAYAQDPEFEHNSHFGDEDMIMRLRRIGRLTEVRKRGEELSREALREAARVKL